MASDTDSDHAADLDGNRRDFLLLVAGAMGAVGVGASIWPFIDTMNPSADVLAAGAPVDVDLSHVQPGQQVVVVWRGRPIFVANRTAEQQQILKTPADTGLLRDANSDALQQPPYAKNWSRSVKPEYLVLVGICTHLGCIPHFNPKQGELDPTWPGGYFCPCHGSKYDLAGRVFKGVPAPLNLPVPPYHFVDDKTIRVGENPPGVTFDLSSVEQI